MPRDLPDNDKIGAIVPDLTLTMPTTKPMTAPITIADYIRVTEDLLDAQQAYCGHGTDNYADEARWLILGSLGLPFDFADTEQTVAAEQQTLLRRNLEQRTVAKQPTAYVLGEAWYRGNAFYVNEHTLVPRSPIAELIHAGCQPWLKQAPKTVLDLCCGSGCIGITAALQFPDAKVDLADISQQALAVSERNIQRYQLEDRVTAIHSDLYGGLAKRRYDVILTNPPYVPQFEYDELPKEYHNEPSLGLVSGADGLELTVPLLQGAAEHLQDDGILILEVGNTMQFLDDCFPEIPFEWLEFADGSYGVCILTKQQLLDCADCFSVTG